MLRVGIRQQDQTVCHQLKFCQAVSALLCLYHHQVPVIGTGHGPAVQTVGQRLHQRAHGSTYNVLPLGCKIRVPLGPQEHHVSHLVVSDLDHSIAPSKISSKQGSPFGGAASNCVVRRIAR